MKPIHKTPQIEPIDGYNIETHVNAWLTEKQNTLSPLTINNYRNRMKPLIAWWEANGHQYEWGITPTNLKEFRHWLDTHYRDDKGRRPATATIHTFCATVRAFFNWLHQSQRLEINISHWLPMPEKPLPNGRFLSLAECQALFDVCEGVLKVRDWAMLAFLLGSGCRCFEAAQARKDALSLTTNGGTVKLHKVKFDREGRKNRGRITVIGATTAKVLRLHLLCNSVEGDPRLLQMSDVAIAERVETLAARAGVKASTHDLRRTFADWWIDHNEDDRAYLYLKLQLGHAIPKGDVTAIHYLDLRNPIKVANRLQRCYTSPVESIQLPDLV